MSEPMTYFVTVLRDGNVWSATVHHDDGEHDTFALCQRGQLERIVHDAMADRLGHDRFRLEIADMFRCAACGEQYRLGNTVAEIEQERAENWPDDEDGDEFVSVCDGCYDRLIAMGVAE